TSWALSKVMFKKEGLVGGDDVESVLGRAQTYLEEGDLDAAAREVNGLEGWAKTLSKDWLGEVRKVLEVRQALDVSFPTLLSPLLCSWKRATTLTASRSSRRRRGYRVLGSIKMIVVWVGFYVSFVSCTVGGIDGMNYT